MSTTIYPAICLNCQQIEGASFYKVGKNTTRQDQRSMRQYVMANHGPSKRGSKMASATVANDKVGKKGAEKKYPHLSEVSDAIIAAGGTVKDKTLEKVVKSSDGTSKTYTQPTKEVDCPNLNAMLAAVNGSEEQMCALFTRAVNNVFQAADRVALANLSLGPARNAVRMVNSMTACNIPLDVAITTVVGLLAAQGTEVTAEDIRKEL